MIKDLRLVANAELRAQQPQGDTPEDAKTDDQQQPDDKQPDKQQPKTIEGYALLFNSPSKDLGGFVEVISPEALDNVDLSQIVMLDQHDYSKPLASVKAGTLKLDVDEKGLHFEAQLDDSVSYANDAYQNVQNGNVDSMSFRFDIDDGGDQFTQDESGKVVRTIKKIRDLFEVSTVTIPAYNDSNVQVDKRSYEEFLDNQKGEKQTMKQTIINPAEQGETRSFDNYVRSQGETRDGLTTDGNGVLVPTEIITPIFKSKKGTNRLSDYTTIKQVSVGQGSYPIAGNDPSKVLATKAENAAIGDVDPEVTGVEFKTQTRAGRVYLSQELVDDNAINFSAEIQAQMQKLVDNTDNAQIVAKLKTLTPVVVKDVDGIKQAKNTKLDPSLAPVVILNQSAFNWLDTQKDSEGRYLMSEDIQAPTGKALFGLPVVELSDAVLPNVAAGQFSMFVGDLAETVAVFRRNQVTTKWQQFDSYSQGLMIAIRNDYQFIDKTATVALTIDTTK